MVSFVFVDILLSLIKMVQDIATESLDYFNNKPVLTQLETREQFMDSVRHKRLSSLRTDTCLGCLSKQLAVSREQLESTK